MQVRRKLLVATLALSATAGAWSLAATSAAGADRVTVVLRSGEKITGELDGQVQDKIYIRTSFSEQPKIALDQIALIDVGGDAINPAESELALARGDAHVLVPRSGDPVKGRLVRIEGSLGDKDNPQPPVAVFMTEGGQERRLPVSEMRRVYLGKVTQLDAPATQTTAAVPTTGSSSEHVVTLAGTTAWADSQIVVNKGDRLTINATGEVTLSTPDDKATPAGAANGRKTPNTPYPDAAAGTLIGRIATAANENGQVFVIGTQQTVSAPATGRLFLGINDDYVGDNTGQFEVRLKVERTGISSENNASTRRRR
jgi:hypothetical protein